MPDLEQLFNDAAARAEAAGQAPPAPASTPGAPRGGAPSAEPSPATAGDDDVLIDLRRLVEEWNSEHGAPDGSPAPVPAEEESPVVADEPPRRRSRLAGARSVLAEHIGSQPAARVVPPTPEPDPVAEAPAADAQAAAADVAGDRADLAPGRGPDGSTGEAVVTSPLVVPSQTRSDRRRARKEVDRLQRECARRPLPDDDAESDVTLLGRVPGSPAELTEPVDPGLVPGDRVAPAVEAPVEELVPLTRRERRQAWKAQERTARAAARGQVRFPILTRSVLVWMFVFMVAGLAFGASAAFWWSQFNSEVDAIRSETSSFTEQVQGAAGALETQRADALAEIDSAMAPLSRLAQPALAPQVAADVAPSMFLVETLDDEGAPAVGSAFVVGTTEDQALLLTSLSVVASATSQPGPDITVRQGERELTASLWNWDVDRDLALLLVDDPDLPVLPWVTDEQAAQALGSGVFAVAGIGGVGATAVPGLVVDQSTAGFQHTAVLGTAYRGGPVLTPEGAVLGVASLDYQPLGFDPGDVHFGVPITDACGSVLTCSGRAATQGAEGGSPLDAPDEG